MRTLVLVALLFAGCRATDSAHHDRQIQVIALQYAEANELASELRGVLSTRGKAESKPSVNVMADPRTNSLIVDADEREMATILDLVAKLDRRVESAGR